MEKDKHDENNKIPRIPVHSDELSHFGLDEPLRDILPEVMPVLDFITEELCKIVPNYEEKVIYTNYGVFLDIVETCLRLQICLGVDKGDKRHNPEYISILIDNLKNELNKLRIMMKGEEYYFNRSVDRGNDEMMRLSEDPRNQRIPEGCELTVNGRDFLPEVVPILNFVRKELSKIVSNYEERVMSTNYGVFSDMVETCLRIQICLGVNRGDRRHNPKYINILIHNLKVEMNDISRIIRGGRR